MGKMTAVHACPNECCHGCVHGAPLQAEEWAGSYLAPLICGLSGWSVWRDDGEVFLMVPRLILCQLSFSSHFILSSFIGWLPIPFRVLRCLFSSLSLSLSLSLSPYLFVIPSSPPPSTLSSSGLLVWHLFLHINPQEHKEWSDMTSALREPSLMSRLYNLFENA